MGDFITRVLAVGGHGCQREKKSGEIVEGCGQSYCPDCIFRNYVKALKASGADVKVASITHWPAELPHYNNQGEVQDDVLTGKRRGSF